MRSCVLYIIAGSSGACGCLLSGGRRRRRRHMDGTAKNALVPLSPALSRRIRLQFKQTNKEAQRRRVLGHFQVLQNTITFSVGQNIHFGEYDIYCTARTVKSTISSPLTTTRGPALLPLERSFGYHPRNIRIVFRTRRKFSLPLGFGRCPSAISVSFLFSKKVRR